MFGSLLNFFGVRRFKPLAWKERIFMSLVGKINDLGTVLASVDVKVSALGAPVAATLDPAVAADIAGLKTGLAGLTATVDNLVAGKEPVSAPVAVAETPAVEGPVLLTE